ncbi:hypothetical protein PSQ19_15565 [Devosia algicola]|uniref:Uncharacterized protein n=1 Tax=Devosia algicola TaxID=3026418 RepID=A0ABY7YLJ5_9HYPH|nr:hypothetical protein [Devosia algicola]WDR02074.1 hypothetical protein PSQ19_15565 [Devosia algicola]
MGIVLAARSDGPNDSAPFVDQGYQYARWVLQVDRLVGSADAHNGHHQRSTPDEAELTDENIADIASRIIACLGALMPRLPDNALRRELTPLAGFVETMHPPRPV